MEQEMRDLSVNIIDLAVAEIDLDIYLGWLQDVISNRFIESARTDYSKSELIEFLSKKLCRSDVKFWGIFTSLGKFIGTVKLDPIDFTQGTAWLGIMIGDTSERGKGLGLLVLEQVSQYALSCNLNELFLGVDKRNIAAVKLYKKSGFNIVSEDEKSLIMRKILGLSTNFE